MQSDEDSPHGRDAVDIPRVAEQIARNTCQALVSFLNLLAANDLVKIGLRVTLDPENVRFVHTKKITFNNVFIVQTPF